MTKEAGPSGQHINLEDLAADIFSPGCIVLNEEVADDPNMLKDIYQRLIRTGNDCKGDIAAGLQGEVIVDDVMDAYLDRLFGAIE